MSDTIQVSGTVDEMSAGFVVFEDLPYVLTVSKAYLVGGWPLWAYRFDNPLDEPFTESLGDLRSGSANIYNGNPVAFQVPAGKFDVGNEGDLPNLITDYLGVFDDFAVYPAVGQDPVANGWVHPSSPRQVNAPAGDLTTAWAQGSALVYPPKNARYVVPLLTTTIPASNSVYLDAFDLRVVPFNESPTLKPSYASPRNLTVKVKPTRLNYATGSTSLTGLTIGTTYTASARINAAAREAFQFVADKTTKTLVFDGDNNLVADGSFESATNTTGGWVAIGGGGVIAKDPSIFRGGAKSLKVIASTNTWGYFPMDGAAHGGGTNPTHTVGTKYTASVYVYSASAQNLRLIDYGTSATNGPTVAVAANTWTRLSVTFVAGTDVFLTVRNPAATAVGTMWLDGFKIEVGATATRFIGSIDLILVEVGGTVGDYFNGSSGPDYLWEQGGTPPNARSYYYQDREARNYILTRLLQENVPMGMKVAQPQYGVN